MVLGVPFEGEVNSRKGADQGPAGIRAASDMAESYSPYFDRDLEEYRIWDDGDIAVPARGSQADRLNEIAELVRRRLPDGVDPIFLGGDHAVSLPLITVMLERFPDLEIVHLDAHADCHDEFEGERFCYATVMRRVSEKLPPKRVHQIGIRTGIKDEYLYCRKQTDFHPLTRSRFTEGVAAVAAAVRGKPLYVSIDIDLLDPSVAPGTANPVSAGVTVVEVRRFIQLLAGERVVGVDLVEVSPPWDPSRITALVAAEILRDCILGWWRPR